LAPATCLRRPRCSACDPDRSQRSPTRRHPTVVRVPRNDSRGIVGPATAQGRGAPALTESVSSPTLAEQIRELLSRFPSARWHQWDPASRDNARAGAKLARRLRRRAPHLDQADVLVALDADFLACGPGRCATRATSAPRGRPSRPDESALRLRKHADLNRLARRPPVPGQAQRDRRPPTRWPRPSAFGR
jgi:molybdopterin-containing oxidoreductase family iron-sulfur binding subunit